MLRVVTLTVEEDTAIGALDALDRYERALHAAEGDRYDLELVDSDADAVGWSDLPNLGRLDEKLGRQLLFDKVEYDPGGPSYVGTRTIGFNRLDTRD